MCVSDNSTVVHLHNTAILSICIAARLRVLLPYDCEIRMLCFYTPLRGSETKFANCSIAKRAFNQAA